MLRQLLGSAALRRMCANALDQVRTSAGLAWRGLTPLPTRPALTAPPCVVMRLQTIHLAPTTAVRSPLLSMLAPTSAAAQHCLPRHFAAQPALADADDEREAALPLEEHTAQGEYRDVVVPLYDINLQQVGTYTLGGDVFDVPIRRDILHRVVRWQLARRQAGTHKTKTRSEVRGGGRKPWAQKGSGRARQGTIRAPQFRGGGVAHGPVPRSHEHGLFKRVRRLGLQCALSAKAWERRLVVVDSLCPADHRTKTVAGHLDALLAGAPRRSALLIDSSKEGEDGG